MTNFGAAEESTKEMIILFRLILTRGMDGRLLQVGINELSQM
jgi:hypothetical protein